MMIPAKWILLDSYLDKFEIADTYEKYLINYNGNNGWIAFVKYYDYHSNGKNNILLRFIFKNSPTKDNCFFINKDSLYNTKDLILGNCYLLKWKSDKPAILLYNATTKTIL